MIRRIFVSFSTVGLWSLSATLFVSKALADGPTTAPAATAYSIVANGCLQTESTGIKIGDAVTVIALNPQRDTHFEATKIAAASCVQVGDTPVGRGFQLEAKQAEGVGVVGSVVGGTRLSLTECASSEGLHRNVWVTVDGKRRKVWHGYRYLGYAAEPDCKAEDYVDPNEGQ